MHQTLSNLIRKPTASERRSFAALTAEQPTFTNDELRLMRSALESRVMQCDAMAEKFTHLAREIERKAPMYLRMANEQAMGACEARALADKITKAVP